MSEQHRRTFLFSAATSVMFLAGCISSDDETDTGENSADGGDNGGESPGSDASGGENGTESEPLFEFRSLGRDMELQVVDTDEQSSVSGEEATGVYFIVNLLFRNNGTESFDFNTYNWELHDDEGRSYERDTLASDIPMSVEAGLEEPIQLAFDVPEDQSGRYLEIPPYDDPANPLVFEFD